MAIKPLEDILVEVRQRIKDYKSNHCGSYVDYKLCDKMATNIVKAVYAKDYEIRAVNVNVSYVGYYGVLDRFGQISPFDDSKQLCANVDFALKIITSSDEIDVDYGIKNDIGFYYVGDDYLELIMSDIIPDDDDCYWEVQDVLYGVFTMSSVVELFVESFKDLINEITRTDVKSKIDEYIVELGKKEYKIRNSANKVISQKLCSIIKKKSLNINGEDLKILKPYLLGKQRELKELMIWVNKNKSHFKYVTDDILENVSNNLVVMDILE